MATQMTTTQKATLSIKPVDRLGHKAPVDGAPVWLTSNTDVLTLTPSADGMSCEVGAVGIPGTATVQVTADADMGAGVEPLVGTIDFEVIPAKATSISITADSPVEQ